MTRNLIVRLVLILISLNSTYALFGQTDSITVTEIAADSIDLNYKKAYRYLEYKLKDDKSIFKLAGETTLHQNNYYTEGISFSYEQKLSPNFSAMAKIRLYNSLEYNYTGGDIKTLGFSLQGRYYLRKKKHIKYNTSGNNCLGAYLLFGAHDIVAYKEYPKKIYSEPERKILINPIYNLGVGYQFFIAKNFFVDLNAYAFTQNDEYYSEPHFGLRFEVSINYAFRLKSRPKKNPTTSPY